MRREGVQLLTWGSSQTLGGGGFVAKQLMKRANDGDEAAAAYQSQQLDFSLPELISLFMLHRITPTVTAAAY